MIYIYTYTNMYTEPTQKQINPFYVEIWSHITLVYESVPLK